jgi:hypothetical protein
MIEQIVTAILKFVESLLRKDQTSEDVTKQPALRQRLLDRIKRVRDKGNPGS